MGVREMDRFLEQWQMDAKALQRRMILAPTPSITTTVQGGVSGDGRRAALRLAWERLARSLRSCVPSSQLSNSPGPNRSRGSISRTTRYTWGRVIWGIFFPPSLLQA